ncbi:DUF1833 family protein [Methylobacillus flagellatus]|uniref:Uncharacterized protein n=1 Tax=Methylobacillus flagellatus (strain ATCC 51484 / DSM 6875 / VKM B-1610 / KT) TaxID=265072 RepID=Q1GXT7_METFK|nr:DUF1833 family protein [Methylobacillus flagellatus]ABE50950.1 phage-related conserved hypothetical protein [Methylobacillus flagellatus KT]
MPDPTLEEAIKEAYASNPVGEVELNTLEFRHPNFVDQNGDPSAIRVVLDNVDHYLTLEDDAPLNPGESVLFVRMAFELTKPEVDSVAGPAMDITLNNITPEIETQIRAATRSPYPVIGMYRLYLLSDKTQPQNNPPMEFQLDNVNADDESITARATFGNEAQRPFPNENYTATRFPGLSR